MRIECRDGAQDVKKKRMKEAVSRSKVQYRIALGTWVQANGKEQ